MEKVILTKKQVGIIESYKKSHNLITILNRAEKGFGCKDHEEMNKLTLEEIASAWINGYEVEETPEDKIFKTYKECIEKRNKNVLGDKVSDEYYYFDGKRYGILTVLELMDIKIKGINC